VFPVDFWFEFGVKNQQERLTEAILGKGTQSLARYAIRLRVK